MEGKVVVGLGVVAVLVMLILVGPVIAGSVHHLSTVLGQ